MWEQKNADTNELDILGRDYFVDNCETLINIIFKTTKSAFIMIDGEWGVGKTFVMNMIDSRLKNEYKIIKYNCWENSYYNDPLEAILSIMIDYIEKDKLWTNEDKEKIKLLLNSIVFMLSLGTFRVKSKYKDNFNGIKQGIKANVDSISLEQPINIHTAINEVKYFLEFNNEKIVILVDEIDRCLPEYGVKTLERLYLLFKDMPNIVVVIANDKNKLEQIIKNVFGYDSIDNYLEKFIDYIIKLSTEFKMFEFSKSAVEYNLFNNYFEKDSFCLANYESQLLTFIFEYLLDTKNIRYVDKLIKIQSNIHRFSFGKKRHLPLYVFILEVLMLEFCKKVDFFTLDCIMNYIINDSQSRPNAYFNFNVENYLNTNNSKISKLNWTKILKKECISDIDQDVILFFELMDEDFAKNLSTLRFESILEEKCMFFNFFDLEKIITDNSGKYDSVAEYLDDFVNFYGFLTLLD